MSPLPRPSWKLLTSLLMLSLVPMVAGVVRLSGLAGGANGGGVTPENARFMANPAPVVLHVLCASGFCVLGALQFDSALRQRFPRLHRIAGRVAAPCGILAALTGLWMTAAYAIPAELQGPLLYGVRMVVGLAMTLAVTLSIRAVLQRRIAQHRAWMVRAYALGQGAGTQVLILLPVTLMAGAPTFMFRDVLMASAWGLNVVFAEWVIRRRRFGLPGFTDCPREIPLNPGVYALELYCFKSLTKPTFRPTLEIAVKAGYAYTVKCDASEGKAAVFVSQETRML